MSPVALVGELTARTIVTRGRLLAMGALGLLGVGVAWRVGAAGPAEPIRSATQFVSTFGLGAMAPIGALVFASAAFGDLVDDKTLMYVWARPVGLLSTTAGAFVAVLGVVVPLVTIPIVLGAVGITSDLGVILGTFVVAVLGAVVYSAFFLLLGLVSRRSLIWGITYVLVYETFVARGGSALGYLSIRSHLESILERATHIALPFGYFTVTTKRAVGGVGDGGALVGDLPPPVDR